MRSIIPGVNFPALNPCWLSTPAESSPTFLPAFVRISLAIQTTLRQCVPAEYFQTTDNFRNLKTAYPMLVYQASPPFRGKKRSELTYDVLNPVLMAGLFRRTKPKLLELLTHLETRFSAEGLTALADRYAPKRTIDILSSVQKLSKSRRYLYLLVRGESALVDAAVQLAGLGDLPAKDQDRRWSSFGKKWNYQLRRFPGRDFTWLAPVLLEAAGAALLAEAELDSRGPGSVSSCLQPDQSEFPEIG